MGEWVGTAGGVIGLVVALGAIVAYLRASADKGTIASLKEYAEASDMRLEQLEKSEARLKAEAEATVIKHRAEIAALNLRMKALEDDNVTLRSQRPSAEAIEAVYSLMQAVHSDTRKLVAALPVKEKP